MAQEPLRRELRSRAWSAILQHAVFRWESAVVIALTLVLTVLLTYPFPWWPWWGWLAVGGVAEALIVGTSVTDARAAQQAVADMFRSEHNPARLRSEGYRGVVERALAYRDQMSREVAQRPDTLLRDRLNEQVGQVDDWVDGIYRLAVRLEDLSSDRLLQQDFQSAPMDLQRLVARLRATTDAETQARLREAVAARQTQVENLNRLRDLTERGNIQLENTLAALGATYAQVQLLTAKDIDSVRARQLQQDIAAQVSALQDVVTSLDEVRGRAQTPGEHP